MLNRISLFLFLSCYSIFIHAWTLQVTVLDGEMKTTGDALQVQLSMQTTVFDNNADIYVALRLPDQSLWFLNSDRLFSEQGHWSQDAQVYQSNVAPMSRQGLVLSLASLPDNLATGQYTFFAVVTMAGLANVADQTRWVSPLSQSGLQISAAINTPTDNGIAVGEPNGEPNNTDTPVKDEPTTTNTDTPVTEEPTNTDTPTTTEPPVKLDNALPIPPQLFGELNDQNELVFPLTLQHGKKNFLGSVQTATLGINGDYLGPTIRVRRGDRVRMQVNNQIGETTTLHWHGIHLPARMDGGPHQTITANALWQPSFDINQPAGTFWYHPHLEGKTGEHVYRGLAGLFIVDDEQSEGLALPKTYGQDDIPLVIQDRRIADNGDMSYLLLDTDTMQGMKGDKILVNGAIMPTLYTGAEVIRLRILNGSNARTYQFGFDDNRSFYHIATDSGFLEAPIETNRIRLAPAERAEILVDLRGDAGRNLILKSYSSEITHIISSNSNLRDDLDSRDFDIMHLTVNQAHQNGLVIPESLVSFNRLDSNNAVTTRQFVLSMRQQNLTINGKKMDMERIDEIVKLNSIEIWEIRNDSRMAHPFHVHDVRFMILDRNGTPPTASENGWKDTVLVPEQETVRIIMQFTDYADADSPYMFHCHILEHEDAGMMGQFIVIE